METVKTEDLKKYDPLTYSLTHSLTGGVERDEHLDGGHRERREEARTRVGLHSARQERERALQKE